MIERDGSQGNLNGFKAIYEIELKGNTKPVAKNLAVDLMNISDPHGISTPGMEGDVGLGEKFAFPFTTIEDVVVFDEKHIGVLNDNNYPFSVGRHVGQSLSDDNEFIIIKLGKALGKEKIKGPHGLTLINAENGQDIMKLSGGEEIKISHLPSLNLSIRADFDAKDVKSVVFDLDGNKNFRTENTEPYSLAGDNNKGKYYPFSFKPGIYKITATPYSLPGGKGKAGKPLKVSFKLEIGQVYSFTMVDAETESDIMDVKNGDIIDLNKLPSRKINIRANVDAPYDVASVVFDWNEKDEFRIENTYPYTLAGDNVETTNYYSFTPSLGFHTITATTYSKDKGLGTAGDSYSATFLVIDSSFDWAKFFDSIKVYPNPIENLLNIYIPYCLETTFTVSLLDKNGKELLTEDIDLKDLNMERLISLDLSNINVNGIFYLRIGSSTMETKTIRLFKN